MNASVSKFWKSFFQKSKIKKWPEQKKLVKRKIIFFMPVNHAKEFLKSVHNEALFSGLVFQNFDRGELTEF